MNSNPFRSIMISRQSLEVDNESMIMSVILITLSFWKKLSSF